MDFKKCMKNINAELRKEQPKTFSSSWIFNRLPAEYMFIRKCFRTENGSIDWDTITASIDKRFVKRWMRYRRKPAKPYKNQNEIDVILEKYRGKLYVLISPSNEKDRNIRHRIVVALVRVAQKGNVLAQNELLKWIRFVVDDWVEKYYQLYKWKGYGESIDEKVCACIRCYKYTGSFFGYLFKTLEYSSRGMRPLQAWSLDDPVGEDGATKIDFVVQDTETGEVKLFGR